MKEDFKLIDNEYESIDEALVEVTETHDPVIIVSTTSVIELQATIDLLNERKQMAIDKFDEEIKLNQDRLDALQPIVASAKVVIKPVPPIKAEPLEGSEAQVPVTREINTTHDADLS